jgi:nucleolar pre-ribosomal-associated protein 2
VEKASEKNKHRLNYALIMVFGAALFIFQAKATPLDDQKIISRDDLDSITGTFKSGLLQQLKEFLHRTRKEKSAKRQTSQLTEHLTILSIMDALGALGVDPSKVAELVNDAKAFCSWVQDTELHIGKRLETFLAVHGPNIIEEELLEGDVSTVNGRQSITQKVLASVNSKDKLDKLKLLDSIFGPGLVGLSRLDKLLAARQVIVSMEDTRKAAEEEENEDDKKEAGAGLDLSEAYSILCSTLWKVSGIRQFCIISETLELMLKTKVIPLPSIQPSLSNINRAVP